MSESTTSERKSRRVTITLLACGLILLLGAGLTVLIFSTEPTAKRSAAVRETAMLVDVIEVRRDSHRPTVVALGTVEPTRDITLRPRVAGEITELAESFTPGGFVEKGETLLRIDPSDYDILLQQRRSELSQARADLMIETGHQNVARRDFEALREGPDVENEALVLREPQLHAAQARVQSAEAAVAQAELDLERTRVKAPFDARVLSRDANVGSQVSPGDSLGRLVGLDTYWVAASVPLSQLAWLSFADGAAGRGSPVRIRNRTAWPEGTFRTGFLDKLPGALDHETRMARVLVSVPDPLAREADFSESPPLIIGSFLEAQIEGQELTDVIRLDRNYVRQGDTVWVMTDGQLQIRDVEIVVRDAEHAYIRSGLDDGDQVVITNLSTVVEGAPLRLEPAVAPDSEQPDAGDGDEEQPEDNPGEAPAR